MPLLKRFQTELMPEWSSQCINYKGLKKQAESLVGEDSDAAMDGFFSNFGAELDKASLLYMGQERKLCNFFVSLSAKFDDATRSLLHKREESVGIEQRPTPQEIMSGEAMCKFVSALLALLVHIDSLRTFSLLNILGVLKIGRSHCNADACAQVVQRLREEPFFACLRLTSLVEEVKFLCQQTLELIFGESASPSGPVSPSSEAEDKKVLEVKMTKEELVTFCTWRNMKGFVPTWVCSSMSTVDGQALQNGDWRSVRIAMQLTSFLHTLSASFKDHDMSHLVPVLLQGMRKGGGAKAPSRTSKPVEKMPSSHSSSHASSQAASHALREGGGAGQGGAGGKSWPRQHDDGRCDDEHRRERGASPEPRSRLPEQRQARGWVEEGVRRVRTCSDLRVLDMAAARERVSKTRSTPNSRSGSRWSSQDQLADASTQGEDCHSPVFLAVHLPAVDLLPVSPGHVPSTLFSPGHVPSTLFLSAAGSGPKCLGPAVPAQGALTPSMQSQPSSLSNESSLGLAEGGWGGSCGHYPRPALGASPELVRNSVTSGGNTSPFCRFQGPKEIKGMKGVGGGNIIPSVFEFPAVGTDLSLVEEMSKASISRDRMQKAFNAGSERALSQMNPSTFAPGDRDWSHSHIFRVVPSVPSVPIIRKLPSVPSGPMSRFNV